MYYFYFYNTLAIVLGILSLISALVYIFKPKSFVEKMNNLEFKHDFKLYCLLYFIISLIMSVILISVGISAFINRKPYDNRDLYNIISYTVCVSLYLLFNLITDKIFVKRQVKYK